MSDVDPAYLPGEFYSWGARGDIQFTGEIEMDPLEEMTQEKWNKLSEAERKTLRSTVNLSPQLVGKEGCRVEVVDEYDERRRFIVSRSTGWKPCHIELKNRTSSGGDAAAKYYKSVRYLETVFFQ